MYQMQFETLFEVKSTQMMSNHGKGRRLDPPTALPPKKIRLRPFPTTNRVEKKSRLYYIQYHNLIIDRAKSDSNMNILEESSYKFLLISIRRLLINSQRNQYWILKVHFIILNLGNTKNI